MKNTFRCKSTGICLLLEMNTITFLNTGSSLSKASMKVFSSLMNVCRYRFLLKYLSSVEKKSDENAKPVGANHVTICFRLERCLMANRDYVVK